MTLEDIQISVAICSIPCYGVAIPFLSTCCSQRLRGSYPQWSHRRTIHIPQDCLCVHPRVLCPPDPLRRFVLSWLSAEIKRYYAESFAPVNLYTLEARIWKEMLFSYQAEV
ncbi:hypothetical protein VTO42DRAFT_5997 [Malbranchea cinnamomea]